MLLNIILYYLDFTYPRNTYGFLLKQELVSSIVYIAAAAAVVGYRGQRSHKKGSAWWINEINKAIERKRRAYEKMLQNNVKEGIKSEEEN